MGERSSPSASLFLAAGAAALAAYVLLPDGAAGVALYSAIGAAAVLALLAGARRIGGRGALPWLLFAAGVALLVAGDTVFDVLDLLGRSTATPSPADWVYLSAYPFLAAGLVVLVRRAQPGRGRTTLLDAAIVTLALVLVLWQPFFGDVHGGDPLATRLVLAAYPSWDLLLLALATSFVFSRPLRGRWAQLLVLALVSLLAADFLWAVAPDGYAAGGWMDRCWLLSYLLWGAAALHPSAAAADAGDERSESQVARHRFVLLAGAVALTPLLLALDVAVSDRGLTAADAVLGAVLLTLLLLRLGSTLVRLDLARRELAARNELLRENEERFRRLFEDAPVGLSLLGRDGAILAANRALARVAGRPLELLVGSNYLRFVHGSEQGASRDHFLEALSSGRSEPLERRFVRPDGSDFWGIVSLSRLADGTMIAHLQDITERKRYEAELEAADREKDELISVVSHDLRTPLTSIVGYLELALGEEEGEPPLDPGRREFLRVAQRNAQRLSRLVEDLLFVSRAQAGRAPLELEEVDLGEVVEHVVSAARPAAAAAGVRLSARGEGATVAADPHRLAEAVENLVSNALKFTPGGGRVEVEVSAGEDEVAIAVHDSGRGIAREDRERVFDRFFRASGSEGVPGAGLGLSIVKAIAEAHGGSVAVESTPGEGATFVVRLPRAAVPAAAGAA